MITVIFIDNTGQQFPAQVEPGQSLMQVALDHAVPGVLAECGGSCSCGTCHVYLDEKSAKQFPPASESEAFLLEIVLEPGAHSRLACQLKLDTSSDGLIVRLPREQL
jgi:ferredoxin, 2Fe-2S